jgi:hypothetical protein
MQFLRLVFAILYISSICYASDKEDIDILHEIAKSSIERDLVESGRYELFKSVLDVYHFALDINEKVSEVLLNKNLHLEPVQGAGLGLYIVIDTNPIYLCMPWGRLDIDGGLLAMDLAKQVTDSFFEKLTLSFESHEAEQEYKRHNVKVDPSVPVVFYGVGRKGLFEIPEQNLKQYRGTSILIKSNVDGNFSCYRIDAIDGKPLPVQKERLLEKDRSLHDINYEWDLLNIMHNRELHIKYQREMMRARQIFLSREKVGEY